MERQFESDSPVSPNPYDEWFMQECLPIQDEKELIALKHLEKFTASAPIGEPDTFSYFTIYSCLEAIASMAFDLAQSPTATLLQKRMALCTLVQNSQGNLWIWEFCSEIDAKSIIEPEDTDLFSLWPLLNLITALLMLRGDKRLGISPGQLVKHEVLVSAILKTSQILGIDTQDLSTNSEGLLAHIDLLQQELAHRLRGEQTE